MSKGTELSPGVSPGVSVTWMEGRSSARLGLTLMPRAVPEKPPSCVRKEKKYLEDLHQHYSKWGSTGNWHVEGKCRRGGQEGALPCSTRQGLQGQAGLFSLFLKGWGWAGGGRGVSFQKFAKHLLVFSLEGMDHFQRPDRTAARV